MKPSAPPASDPDPKARLLDVAERFFAERGPGATGIRELAQAAGVNVAAVSYHFGGKEQLYLAVLKRAFKNSGDIGGVIAECRARAHAKGTRAAAEEALGVVIRRFMAFLDHEGKQARTRLVLREMADPTEALGIICADFIGPSSEALLDLIGLLRPDLVGTRKLRIVAANLAAQCVFYTLSRPIALFMLGDRETTEASIDEIAEVITASSIAALARA
jgi:AcrR family transcriptional regulator